MTRWRVPIVRISETGFQHEWFPMTATSAGEAISKVGDLLDERSIQWHIDDTRAPVRDRELADPMGRRLDGTK